MHFILTKNNIYELKNIVNNHYNHLIQDLKYTFLKPEDINTSSLLDNNINQNYINQLIDLYKQINIINEIFILCDNIICNDQYYLLLYLKHTNELLHIICLINTYLWLQWTVIGD